MQASDRKLPYFFIAPAFLYLVFIMLFPLLWAVWISFTNKSIGSPAHFVGLSNYISLVKDPVFLRSVVNTLVFTAASVSLKVVLGLIMALTLNQAIRARNVWRALLLLPWTLPSIVSILTWKWMFSDIGGILNYGLQKLGLIEEPLLWLGKPDLAMLSVVLVNVWRGMPFIGLSLLAGLQTISHEMYEAAHIDGANVIRRFIHITLPLLTNVLLLSALVTTIWTLNNFDVIYLLTNGGPVNSTNVISLFSYNLAFTSLRIGKAIAVSVLSLPFLVLLVNIVTKRILTSEE